VPRTKKKAADEELEELMDELEDDELEDEEEEYEEEDEEEEEDEDEEPDEAPRARSKRGRAKKAKKRTSNGVSVEFGAPEVADLVGTTPRQLRALLRAEPDLASRTDGDTGRYSWRGPNDPKVKAIMKRVKGGAIKEAQAASLEKLKSRKSKKKSSAKGKVKTRRK
jgi:hypothetical protein